MYYKSIPSNRLNDALTKLDEVRAIFVIGQRAVPLLEDLLHFVREMTPLLEEVSQSLHISTARMPTAASQLERVSHANELATTEILDLVDAVQRHIHSAASWLNGMKQSRDALRLRDQRLLDAISSATSAPGVREALQSWYEEGESLYASWEAQEMERILDTVRDHMQSIMMSLQVQDITAQQIASVNHLIESTRQRMAEIVERLSHDVLPQAAVPDDALAEMRSSQSRFDPLANYDSSGKHQANADDLVNAFLSGENLPLPQEEIAPEEPIIRYSSDVPVPSLGARPAPTQTAPAPRPAPISAPPPRTAPPPPPKPSAPASFDPVSQDDIDALFNT